MKIDNLTFIVNNNAYKLTVKENELFFNNFKIFCSKNNNNILDIIDLPNKSLYINNIKCLEAHANSNDFWLGTVNSKLEFKSAESKIITNAPLEINRSKLLTIKKCDNVKAVNCSIKAVNCPSTQIEHKEDLQNSEDISTSEITIQDTAHGDPQHRLFITAGKNLKLHSPEYWDVPIGIDEMDTCQIQKLGSISAIQTNGSINLGNLYNSNITIDELSDSTSSLTFIEKLPLHFIAIKNSNINLTIPKSTLHIISENHWIDCNETDLWYRSQKKEPIMLTNLNRSASVNYYGIDTQSIIIYVDIQIKWETEYKQLWRGPCCLYYNTKNKNYDIFSFTKIWEWTDKVYEFQIQFVSKSPVPQLQFSLHVPGDYLHDTTIWYSIPSLHLDFKA